MICLPEFDSYTREYADMSMEPLTVTAHLKPPEHVVAFDPVYLDNLLARCVVVVATGGAGLPDTPDAYWIPLPLKMAWSDERGLPLWSASVFLPSGPVADDVFYQHKRTSAGIISDTHRIHTNVGRWMDRRVPYPVKVCRTWQARCVGNRDAILDLLSGISYLGKRHAIGFGAIECWEVEPAQFDSVFVIDGCLAHAIPGMAVDVLGGLVPMQPMTLVGWTPPQWKPGLHAHGWQVRTSVEVDYFGAASKLG